MQGALFVKKQAIRASGRKKKSLAGQVTEKSVSIFVDKIRTETEKCWSENEHQPNLRDINIGIPSPVKRD